MRQGSTAPQVVRLERQRKEALHEKFRRHLIRGKARFNFVRASVWRKEAMATMNRLIAEEKKMPLRMVVVEPVLRAAERLKRKRIIPRYRRRAATSSARKAPEGGAFVMAKKQNSNAPRRNGVFSGDLFSWRMKNQTITATDSVVRTAAVLPCSDESPQRHGLAHETTSLCGKDETTKTDVEPPTCNVIDTPNNQVSPETTSLAAGSRASETSGFIHNARYRSVTSDRPPSQPGPRVSIDLLAQTCRVRGSCFVSASRVAYDERLRGWRFLDPGVSAMRFEFKLTVSDGLYLRVHDFETMSQTAVDIRLNRQPLVTSHSPRKCLSIPLPELDIRTRHTLEVRLCSQAAPWAYHLEKVVISRPHAWRAVPSPDEIPRLLASPALAKPAATPGTMATSTCASHPPVKQSRDHDALLETYMLGYRGNKRAQLPCHP